MRPDTNQLVNLIVTPAQKKIMALWPKLVVFLLTMFISYSVFSQEPDAGQLQELQTQIKDKQEALAQKIKTAEGLQGQLRQAELEISRLTKASIISERELAQNRSQQKALEKQKSQLTQQKNQQTQLLSNQVRAAFMAGDHDYTKMLLSQENAGRFERMLVYYDYLNQARQTQIERFSALLAKLADVDLALAEKLSEIETLIQQQRQQTAALQQQQAARETTLAQIQATIDDEAAQIEQLQINEQQLAQAISEAISRSTARQDIQLLGLTNVKGQLQKPVDGRYRRLFGKRRQGQVRWKGVIFESGSGQPVAAIHQGKVLYADWLKGLGLVTVIDHGDGFMSLYGHNQALLRQAGDIVDAGETIALVGQSGGQSRPGLYFELRHKGQAINPSNWLNI